MGGSHRARGAIDLDRFYAAVEDDAAFQALPDAIAAACGSRSAMVLFEDAATGLSAPLMNYWPGDACARYFAEFTDADPWEAACRRAGLSDGRPVAADALLPPEAFARTTIYNELLRPLGDDTGRCLGVVLNEGPVRFQIGAHRAARDDAFDDASIATMADVRDHVARVMRLRALLDAERGARRTVETMLAASDRALLLVDARLRIVRATAPALAIVDADDGLGVRHGRLTVAAPAALVALRAIVAATIADRPVARDALACPRPSDAPAYRMRVLPAGRAGRGHALLVLDDPARDPGGGIRAFAGAYGLTAAETAIAQGLVAGLTIEEIAAGRGVRRETIRTQVKSLFARTGTNRQADLVRLFATLPGPPR